jgi:nucleoside-diphosphate-sugar epimerase
VFIFTEEKIMKVLFIGGTGIISSACTDLAIQRGFDLYLLNRGVTTKRGPLPEGVKVLKGDIRDKTSAISALGDHQFDAVVEWIAFTTDHIEMDLDLFLGRTKQYVFISTASAYQTPPAGLPVTESTVLDNPFWEYSRNKIACEERLIQAYREEKFPITIVRPSHTYDKTLLPFDGGFTVVDRMRKGKPVIVIGDGTSLWTLTHHKDFARAFIGLLGNPHAIGEDFHITNDEWLPWNQIYQLVAEAAGVPDPKLVHIPSELIAAYEPNLGAGLLGDKSHSMIFDNTKVKRAVPGWVATIPFSQGVREIMAWYDEDPSRQVVDEKIDALMDKIIQAYQSAWPKR